MSGYRSTNLAVPSAISTMGRINTTQRASLKACVLIRSQIAFCTWWMESLKFQLCGLHDSYQLLVAWVECNDQCQNFLHLHCLIYRKPNQWGCATSCDFPNFWGDIYVEVHKLPMSFEWKYQWHQSRLTWLRKYDHPTTVSLSSSFSIVTDHVISQWH